MKIPRFLKSIMAILVCIAFIRETNNAGPISISEILIDIQGFEFNFEDVTELLNYFTEENISNTYYTWNDNLTGIDGFATNFKNTMVSFFNIISNVFILVIKGLWNIITQTLQIIGQLLNITLKATGFKK